MTEPTKYSVQEIDAMRRDIAMWGFLGSDSYYPEQRAKEIEDRLRTYMQNGTTVDELRTALQKNGMAFQRAIIAA